MPIARNHEVIHLGKDNTNEYVLTADDQPVDLAPSTRMTLTVGGVTIDSDTTGHGAGQPFDWTEGNGKLVLAMGGQALVAGNYEDGELTVYDTAHPNGLVWTDSLGITVK